MWALGKADQAAAAFRLAIRLDPHTAARRFNLGNAVKAKGDLDGAAAVYREGIRIDPKNAQFHDGLGNVLSN